MDKFARLTAFVRVVEHGGFAAAARVLGLSRAQVSRAVIGLEAGLGVHLLNRTTRTVAVTPAGRAFYDRARAILADLAEAEAAIRDDQDEPRGELKINAPMSFGTLHLGPALVEFMAQYPQIRVELVLNDRFIDPVAEGFDMTVRIAEPAATPSLIDHPIIEAKRVICAAPAFLRDHGPPQRPADLAVLPCLHYGHLAAGQVWRLTGPEGTVDTRVNGVFCSNNGEVLCQAAVASLGIVMLPGFITRADLEAGRLVPVLTGYRAPAIFLTLLYPPNRHFAPRLRRLIEFLYNRFGDGPGSDTER